MIATHQFFNAKSLAGSERDRPMIPIAGAIARGPMNWSNIPIMPVKPIKT